VVGAAQADASLGGELRKTATALQVCAPDGDGPSAFDGHWDGYAWVREVWVAVSHLNP